jgi:hypothetical protein
MAIALQVRCINRTTRTEPHERIQNVGGIAVDDSRWKLSESQAIAEIKRRAYAFYVDVPLGHRVEVIIATRLGREYLKTRSDGEQPDNLLALPECPR